MNWTNRFDARIDRLMPSEAVSELLKLAEKPDVISFAGGLPDPESLPLEPIREAMNRVLRGELSAALTYGPSLGYTPLREWIAHRMKTRYRVPMETRNIAVTSGGVEALNLICLTLLSPGDTVVVGAPTYMVALHVFRAHQANIVSIDLDEGGFSPQTLGQRLDSLAGSGAVPKLVYVVPSFHNPTGITMDAKRRRQLVDVCDRYRIPIVEDHAYADLRYDGDPIDPIQSLAPDRVVLVHTFSKIFAPGVRLGWVAADSALIKRIGLCKIGTDTCSSTICQRLVHTYGIDGGIDAQVAAAIALYRRKRDLLLGSLKRHMPETVSWTLPKGGFYVWLTLPEPADSEALLRRAIEREKTAFVAGGPFFADGRGKRHIRLSFSSIPQANIEAGVKRIAATIRS